ncbi:hypothetical protein [Paracoccus sulfuroxidans]|uniref:Uncharacterized protein n=1 Tax=Paracoccus sulfuroxidans TaxID=384678 RepID=A0A562NB36_9RHOB|nr:hypothetical protein [Paracoccus sulfuroxidans]TWI29379.1 hypothetical protein IQ24_03586 [Paracoccus sulfuroxidans]
MADVKNAMTRRTLLAGAAMGALLLGSRISARAADAPARKYLPVTARILNSGHSLVDAIFAGAGDRRQTLTSYHPQGARNWRLVSIPGSSMAIRWDWRFGAEAGAIPDRTPGAYSQANEYSPVLPGRDMAEFDALFITEGGPFAVPLDVDGFNQNWNASNAAFQKWRELAAGKPVFFWTIWPATTAQDQSASDLTWRLAPSDRRDIPPFLAFLDRYEKTAEQWCSQNGQQIATIIPGHRLYWELYCRFNDYEGRPQLPGAWADIWADDGQSIHANHLGSVFISVMYYRWMFGEYPDRAIVAKRLAEAETNHGITEEHVFEVVEATLDYVQGPGVDLQTGSFVPPTPFWDASGPGTANVIGSYTPGEVMGESGLWWEIAEDIDSMYLLLQVSHTGAHGTQVPVFAANNPKWSWWDGKMQGLILDVSEGGKGGRVAACDGDGIMAAPLDVMGGPDSKRWIECYIGPKGARVKFLDTKDQWLGEFSARGKKSLPSTRIGVNVGWNDEVMAVTEGNFAIHAGLAYLSIPDDLTRLRLIAHVCGGIVP